MSKSFFIKTYGCQMNLRDSEIIAQILTENGYIESIDIDQADLVLLNTCSIRAKAEQKVMSMLGALRKNKKSNPNMQICVAGCVAQQEGRQIRRKMPHVDLIVGTQNIYNIHKLLERTKHEGSIVATNLDDKYAIPKFVPETAGNESEFRKFVTIMQGCNNFCTYCVVPYTRGREVSRKAKDIVEEVKVLVDSGIKEITLLGQNVNSYAITNTVTEDGTPYSFAKLLRAVAAVEGLKRLRFTTSNPKDLSEDLMECFRDIDILCPQFHLPVQAGSDNVLKEMNRKYTIAGYLELVDKLRACKPDIALSTDIIIGFPGETDEDFEGTMELLEKIRYHSSFSFKYSDRPGTKANEYTNKVEEAVKSARLARFQARQDEICLERNNEYIGNTYEILIEGLEGQDIKGRTAMNNVVHIVAQNNCKLGDFIMAKITGAGQHSLRAELA
ncbi:MAG: tRNA (N6-isopentenyl adenosine(37)-C2)-methylthiotransferase MiaB [Desulfotalea sp.]